MDTSSEKPEISVEVPYTEQISRLFIFRFLWMYVLVIVMIPVGIWMGIIMFLQFWYMLFLGKRHEGFWGYQKRLFIWISKWNAYSSTLTDKRPGFWF